VRALIEGQSLQRSGQSETVIAVKMRDENVMNGTHGEIGVRHLSLRSFTGIEEKARLVPSKKVAIVISMARRHLARSAEDDQLASAHFVIVSEHATTGYLPINRNAKNAKLAPITIPTTTCSNISGVRFCGGAGLVDSWPLRDSSDR
jgi:hypothetical protein